MASKQSSWFGRDGLNDLLFKFTMTIVTAVLIAIVTLPYLFSLSISFRLPPEFYTQGTYWIPKNPSLNPWFEAWEVGGDNFMTTVYVATGTMILSLIVTIPGAYVFARKEFPGKKLAFYLIILTLLFPYILLIIPIASIWIDTGLYNTIPGLWIAYQTFIAPFAIWILRDFFEKLPANIEEAAQVYGCTQWSAFVRVILPLSAPAIMAVGFLSFLIGWNDFLFSNMLTTGGGAQPAVVALFQLLVGGERVFWGQVMALSFIVGGPPTILYLISRRYLTSAFAVR